MASMRLSAHLVATLPAFKFAKFFLNPEMSLADCALAPLIWRLPFLSVTLPKEAQSIIAQAKADADEYAAETRRKLSESIERRTRQAEQKIAQAEAAAVKDVRNAAVDLAAAAATGLIAEAAKGAKGADLVAQSIEAVKARLN